MVMNVHDNDEFFFTENYSNYPLKEIQKIADYYGLKRTTKIDMISKIMMYESDHANINSVSKRKIMWSFMYELNKDVKMKKYILWN